ncbi:deoxycytidine triphosphate deaminase [Methylobacterium sp. WL19]|uniref:dCTP deaminase n=1 Tax=Methylobacterium sp. WL19 TaxID=2603896 RepID=UPI0011CB56E8|nr:deoxycytidine triphosphate deaminase [Methylobacterium sp. WL19]TXN33938.1 deoxycytidine triphosphate deaminase [Methylobacterium sp. WL19]
MILPYQQIRDRALAGMIAPFFERTISHDRTFGLGPASYDVRLKQDMWLWPFWGRLASTVETFRIPDDVLAEVKDKSSNARIFVLVQNTLIDPGFEGGLTLELTRMLPWPIRLKAGTPIAQIKFTLLNEPTERPYRGRYQHQSSNPEPARKAVPRLAGKIMRTA